ncbi:MAG: hypothetical protein PHI40_05685 [Caldisericia bacterium]|nr:hypothetical protein [Caldisericia bacterium]MDD4614879.1 hypothetical protein [Caldisericia bacterium]
MIQQCVFWNSVFILFLIVFYMILFGSAFWTCKLHHRVLLLTGTVSDILFIPWIFLFPAVIYDFTEDSIVWLYLLIGFMFIVFFLRYAVSKKTVYFVGMDDPDVLMAAIKKTLEQKKVVFSLDENTRQFLLPEVQSSIFIEKNTKMVASVGCKFQPTAKKDFFKDLWKSSIVSAKHYESHDGKTFLMFVIAFLLLASAFILISYKVYHLGFFIWG